MTPRTQDEVVRELVRHQTMLGAFLLSCGGDWDLVDEARQETAVYICNHWQDFTPGTNFGAWARSIARLRLHEAMRKRGIGTNRLQPLADCVAEIPDQTWEDLTHDASDGQRLDALRACVASLPDNYRSVVDLHYTQNLDCTTIASRLARSIEATYMLLSRIRTRLRQCVERRLEGGAG